MNTDYYLFPLGISCGVCLSGLFALAGAGLKSGVESFTRWMVRIIKSEAGK